MEIMLPFIFHPLILPKPVTDNNCHNSSHYTSLEAPKISTDKLMGKECIFCDQLWKSKTSGILFLHLGWFQKDASLQEEYLTDENEFNKILQLLEEEFELMK